MVDTLRQDYSIGMNLKKLRKEAHLTQRQVAAQLEVMQMPITEDILAKMEQGKYGIKIGVLVALKRIYNVKSYDAFFEGLE